MDATTTHVLSKLDQIREHQIKEGEALSEIRHLLRQSPAPLAAMAAAPATMGAVVASKVETFISRMTPLTSLLHMMIRHAIAVGTIVYLTKSGQADKALPYVNWLLGM